MHCVASVVLFGGLTLSSHAIAQEAERSVLPGGCLQIVEDQPNASPATCPLQHTDVRADIAGFLGRVTVKQTFHNPTDRKIEAVYVFPLPNDAAVDGMTMLVGDRRIVGQIKPREDAREIYEQAKAAGHVASLLDQERPNIFTQSIANIEPGVTVDIEITYVETVPYEDGMFEWTFPMVVGPRYIPGGGSTPRPLTNGRNTAQVPDGSKITPPVTPKGTRAGHDISLAVNIDGGSAAMAATQIHSELHKIRESRGDQPGRVVVQLANEAEIPNRDFVLRYRLGDDEMGNALLTHSDERGNFFTLVLQPPKRVVPDKVVPRELVFVLDTSGSMSGFPIDKAKEVMALAIEHMRPGDTFNLITFAGDTHILWDAPKAATQQNIRAAQQFLASRRGGGGTEMMKAINVALVQTRDDRGDDGISSNDEVRTLEALRMLPADGRVVRVLITNDQKNLEAVGLWTWYEQYRSRARLAADSRLIATGTWTTVEGEREFVIDEISPAQMPRMIQTADGETLRPTSIYDKPGRGTPTVQPIRVVCFMTDGYVGNDMAIIDAVKKNAGTTRVFSFGIGNSVNRFLLDEMARKGRGAVEYVSLNANADGAVQKFHERISAPVLTDVAIDWGNVAVADVYPQHSPDLWSSQPVVVTGKFVGNPRGTITLRGNTGAGGYSQEITLGDSLQSQENSAIASVWARAKVDNLMSRDYAAAQQGRFPEDLKKQVVDLGLTYNLMTQFTSFVAVEELSVTTGGESVTVQVPVEMPDGVSYEGVFGDGNQRGAGRMLNVMQRRISRGGAPAPVLRTKLRNAPPAPKAAAAGRPVAADAAKESEVDWAVKNEEDRREKKMEPVEKLATALRDVADKLDDDGNFVSDDVTIRDYRVDVIVVLSALDDATLDALKALGFAVQTEAVATKLVIGSIDVRKLIELAEMEVVVRVRPVAGS